MNVLDLFSGLEGWSSAFRDRGHSIYRVELDERFPAEHRDILDFNPELLPWKPDIILASPPCTAFTVMQIGRNWTKDHKPKTERAVHGLKLATRTVDLIKEMNPMFFVIENPRGKLRKLPVMDGLERRTVTYCQYGENRMKPTDLWAGFPPSLILNSPCKNGSPCHISAPRGSMNGTQGMDSALSAKIPYALSLQICLAAEKDLNV